jgi:hypothetical protein
MTGESEDPRGEVLAYKSPQGKQDEAAPHRPLPAVLLCLPAILCWGAFLALLDRFFLRLLPIPRIPQSFARFHVPWLWIVLIVWVLAVVTALVSIDEYVVSRRKPRPWYVWLNLLVNISGLLFTFGVLLLILYFWGRHDSMGF